MDLENNTMFQIIYFKILKKKSNKNKNKQKQKIYKKIQIKGKHNKLLTKFRRYKQSMI